jgi:putative ABC transport system permease protein
MVVAVGAATAATLGVTSSLALHDARTESFLESEKAKVATASAELEDAYRRITKDLGYNVLILPKDQNLADFHADDFATKYMSEDAADRLAASRVVTVNHLLPSLHQKVRWPEAERTILLIGTKGQVPISHQDAKAPIQESVISGTMVVGSEIARLEELAVGSKTPFFGRELTVARIQSPRGTKDDITVWVHLSEAQELLGKKGKINAILALECNCPGNPAERQELIRKEITGILPDTQIIVSQTKSEARVQARKKAHESAMAALSTEEARRVRLREDRFTAGIEIVALVLFVAAISIGVLALLNARSRSAEIGIFRAIGVRTRVLLAIILARAAAAGLAGGAIGSALGLIAAGRVEGAPVCETWAVLPPWTTFAAMLGAPLLAIVCAWPPARNAAEEDPAVTLRAD